MDNMGKTPSRSKFNELSIQILKDTRTPVGGTFSQAPQYADAAVDKAKGVLICSTADEAALHALSPAFVSGVYHSFDYPFYYYNLRANAANRAAHFLSS